MNTTNKTNNKEKYTIFNAILDAVYIAGFLAVFTFTMLSATNNL